MEVASREEFNNRFYDQSYIHEDQTLNKSFDKNQNKVIFVKHTDERIQSNKISSNAKELDSILNKYKASPKHVDSSFRSFYEKSNRSSGSLNSNKQNSQKTIDSKRGYANSKSNNHSNNQLNTSNPNLKHHTKQYQNYVNEAKNTKINQESKYEQHQNLNQNKIFKQLQYADQKNVFHRLSRQSPLKYDSNIKPTQQNQLKKQNSQNSKIGKEDLDYKQQVFKENYTQNINKQYIQTFNSPPRNCNQFQNQKQQRVQLENSKSPKQINDVNSKNSNDSFLHIKQLQQHLNCYLGDISKFKQSEKQNDNYFAIPMQKRSNSILSVQKERSSHSRSKTEQQTRSTSPQKKQNSEEISEIYVKMVEIECEQKELEMKQNILEQYKKLLKHKIEAKDKKQITKIKALQKDLQINLNILDENLNDISNIEACDASQNNYNTPKDMDENKKQIRFQLTEEDQMSQTVKNLKNSQSAKSFNSNPTKSNIKNKLVPEKTTKNQMQNQKQKVIYSDLVKKAKNQVDLNETQQYKPCLPNILMQKIKDQGKQTEKQLQTNDKKQQIQKQKSQSPSYQDQKKQKSTIQLMQAREDFLKKCSQQKKDQLNTRKLNVKQQENQKNDNITYSRSNSSKLINNNSSKFINYTSNNISNNNSSNTIHNNSNRQKIQVNNTTNTNDYENYPNIYSNNNNKNSPSFSKQKSITIEDTKQSSNRDIQENENINSNSKLQQSTTTNSTFQNPSLNYREQVFPINQHDMNLKINELRTCMTVSNLTAQEEENKNLSQFNYIVSENQWNSQVESKGNISANLQQAQPNQFNTSQFIQSNKNIQPIQNNYSSYTIYGCPSQNDNNRYAEYNLNHDTNQIEINQSISNLNNLNNNQHTSLFVNDPKISFTNLNIENVQSSPKWQENENNFNWKGAADGQLDNVMQCSASHSYIKQMIQQTNSTQTKNAFNNNELKTKEFDEPEDFINKNINWQFERSSQKDIQALQQEEPYDLSQINASRSINICSNDQFQATIPLYIQQRSDSPQNQQNQKPHTSNRLHANLQKQINKILEGNQQNAQQINQEIKYPTTEEACNQQQKISKPKEALSQQNKQFLKICNQQDLISNQVFDNEVFDIENQKYDILEIQSPQYKLIREASLKSEKLQLLQFQLQEQLLKNLEEEEKKISFLSATQNVVDDISSRNMKWLQSREKKLNQKKEQKSKKELDGCTFKPNLLSQKYSNDSHSPSKFSSNSHLDQQQLTISNDSNFSNKSKSPIARYENPSSKDKLSIFSKSQYGSSQVLSKQNSNSSNFVQKNKQINPKENKQQNISYQQMNFKKRGSLHKIN
ncbi:hypothetical protein TTHERM_00030490 (macronuclear) [Tetrahymena thermophila SB210]|uniref:Uncharacterized protein n=1 Tax=Tetrahymena thermophila (strain SB210) TaxID=312017 RepID=Q22MS4_TETTS|nr:hypothetical protein TTHERM_00030490 [Tetrahymena thermophila SB210]EAR86379.2 hypothetical protein TTHERM_00030490 [Tetrahymena thermophila SB210]|eukprot:XP_976946.2 hypothetical protein TTHERM_00030490 [Tetrahymena thermophila SB210]